MDIMDKLDGLGAARSKPGIERADVLVTQFSIAFQEAAERLGAEGYVLKTI